MSEIHANTDPEVYEAVRDGLADATGIHPDFLEDNDIDVDVMYWHVQEIIADNVSKIVMAINAVGLSGDEKKFIAEYLERFSKATK